MGIQINGNTDTISATDGSLVVSGAELPAVININATGIITASQINVGTAITISGGIVTATSFSGDGSALTGIAGTANVSTNTLVVAGVTTVSAGSTSAPSITPSGDSNTGIFFPAADTIAFGEGGSEAMRIDSSSRLLVGTSSARSNISVVGAGRNYTPSFQFEYSGSQDNGASYLSYSASNYYPVITLGTSASNTAGTNALVSSGNDLGVIQFVGNDGSNFATAAAIRAYVDGTPGTNDMPGRLVFSTTADGASNPTVNLVIDNTGRTNLVSDASQASSFVRNAKFRLLNGNSARTCDFALMNSSFSDAAVSHTCETANASTWRFTEYYSSRRYDNTSGDQEFALRGDGNGYADGSWNGGGADYAEYFEWSDGNTTAEDRRGISVVLDGDKIREAVAGEEPIGVISGNPSVVGDDAWNKWSGKYLRDDFGTYLRETYILVEWQDENGTTQSYESDLVPDGVIVPDDAVTKTVDDAGNILTRRVLNPDYDPDVEYINRENRPEWDAVGLMGKLRIRKGQPVGARWIKMRDISDTVEEWLVR